MVLPLEPLVTGAAPERALVLMILLDVSQKLVGSLEHPGALRARESALVRLYRYDGRHGLRNVAAVSVALEVRAALEALSTDGADVKARVEVRVLFVTFPSLFRTEDLEAELTLVVYVKAIHDQSWLLGDRHFLRKLTEIFG